MKMHQAYTFDANGNATLFSDENSKSAFTTALVLTKTYRSSIFPTESPVCFLKTAFVSGLKHR